MAGYKFYANSEEMKELAHKYLCIPYEDIIMVGPYNPEIEEIIDRVNQKFKKRKENGYKIIKEKLRDE